MSEAELIDQILSRREILWNLNQWWVSISFAVMLAAYMGAQHLNRTLAGLIIVMYCLYTFTLWEHVLALAGLSTAYTQALSALADSSQLSFVGQAFLEEKRPVQVIFPIFMVTAFLVTNGFVLYCHKKLKKPHE